MNVTWPDGVEHHSVVADPDQFIWYRHGVDVSSLPVIEVRVRLPDLIQHLDQHKQNLILVADPGFPWGDVNPLGGANMRFCQIFPKTA